MRINLYPWIKLLMGGALFIAYNNLHISHSIFIMMFIAIEIIMILLDIFLRMKKNIKILSGSSIVVYAFYNYFAISILLSFK